jgi:hypothetical protein
MALSMPSVLEPAHNEAAGLAASASNSFALSARSPSRSARRFPD